MILASSTFVILCYPLKMLEIAQKSLKIAILVRVVLKNTQVVQRRYTSRLY